MVARWSSHLRLLVGTGLLLVVFGVGWWVGGLGRSGVPNVPGLNEFPYVVGITHAITSKASYGGIEVRDRQIIGFLDTLFPEYRREVQAGPPSSPVGEHYVLEFTLEKVGYAKRLVVWSEGDIEYWSGGGDRLRVQGSFRRMMEWLPVRRAIELATRPQTADDVGPKVLTTRREEFLRAVIDNAQHQVGQLRFWAIREVRQ